MNAINWESLLKSERNRVQANECVIRLTAHVPTFVKKAQAKKAAKNVADVKSVTELIEVIFDTF